MRTRVRDLLVLMVSAKPKVRVEDRGREPNLRERESGGRESLYVRKLLLIVLKQVILFSYCLNYTNLIV